MYNKKVCILGAAGVGKSSLIRRFKSGKFNEACMSNTGARINKVIRSIEHDKVQLMLWDIQDESDAPGGFLNYIKNTSAIIYVVDGTRLETLKVAMELRLETEKHLASGVPSIILFNKSDLVKGWEVSSNMISKIESEGIVAILTSCKEGTGVNTAFNLITRVVMGKTAMITNFTIPSDQAGAKPPFPTSI
ncbi:MAG: GTP-binding protein [Gammaproteobacteria bacterium]|nr:GTP-binding protein [Gammaproteobacteria bacterium]